MSIILTVKELKEKLALHNEDIVLIDVRGGEGEAAYYQSHIPEAVFLDIQEKVTVKSSFFPEPNILAEKLGELGVSNEKVIVLYDEGNHRFASKAWFALYYLGHEEMFILDGGFQAWIESGSEVTTAVYQRPKTVYTINLRKEVVINIDEVKSRLQDEHTVLIDSRSYERYSGQLEPKYKKAGHIPGAVNFHSKLVFYKDGRWKTKEDLVRHFAPLKEKDEIIISCGSGNSACLNAIALKEAGFNDVTLYPGGFSEWIKDDANEVATNE